jgi:23S rRNA (cytosine1962-C5)-methyltransferase
MPQPTSQPPHPSRRPSPPPGQGPRHSGGEAAAVLSRDRMKALQHTGPLPWVQLRNANFHPSIFKKMIGAIDGRAKNGDLVSVYDRDGVPFGTGLLSRHSTIGLRMLTFDDTPVDEGLIEARLAGAIAMRTGTLNLDRTTNAYRLVHAEGDGLPGLIVDRLGEHAVVELFSYPMHRRIDMIRRALLAFAPVKEVLVRADERVQAAEGFSLDAEAPKGPQEARSPDRKSTVVTENGLRFQIDLTHGHKTGFFCDQRENRLALTQFTAGKHVLDLCAYSGGFGVYAAALGKAEAVTCVDLDEDAIALARRNANLNQVPRSVLETVHADAFVYLRQIQAAGKTFDVVVLDPPKLIAAREEMDEGRMKYFDLNRLALTVVKPGGMLVTCSCSGLLAAEEFFTVLRGAARGARRRVQVIRQTGPGPDHPVMTDCPESGYLKCLWARVW